MKCITPYCDINVATSNKALFDIATELENQHCNLEAAIAVLIEITERFDSKIEPGSAEAHILIMQSKRIANLFFAAMKILSELEEDHRDITARMYEQFKLGKIGIQNRQSCTNPILPKGATKK
jgi:hypothetical protein